jgi:hypothetical protein
MIASIRPRAVFGSFHVHRPTPVPTIAFPPSVARQL